MLIPDITICRASEAADLAETEKYDLAISIEHPGATYPGPGAAPPLARLFPGHGWETRQLALSAWDIERPVSLNVNGLPFRLDPPDKSLIERVLDFYKRETRDGHIGTHLLIHCHAGKSRSTAVALGIWYNVLSHERGTTPQDRDFIALQCVRRLKRIRPQAAPNRLIVEMFDEKFGSGGALWNAVQNDPLLTENRVRADIGRNRQIESGDAQPKP